MDAENIWLGILAIVAFLFIGIVLVFFPGKVQEYGLRNPPRIIRIKRFRNWRESYLGSKHYLITLRVYGAVSLLIAFVLIYLAVVDFFQSRI